MENGGSPIVVNGGSKDYYDPPPGSEGSTVVAFAIPPIDDPRCLNVRAFRINELDKIRGEVNAVKNLYDAPYKLNPKHFYRVTRRFEHADTFREEVHLKYRTPNVSNAWLKAYEMFIHYKVFPKEPTEKFTYFDNAAFPGSFLLAAHHMVATVCRINSFEWWASSLLSRDEQVGGIKPLEDKYLLYKNYPDHWLMSSENNGDVTDVANQRDVAMRIGGTVDLYTSDLGFDVSDDYNNQELAQARANLGQIVTGLMVLREGGSMITKQYSYFEPFTVSVIGVMTRLFNRVEVCKGMFSKAGNSETYLVGIGYVRREEDVKILVDRLANWDNFLEGGPKPVITKGCLGRDFITAIIKSQSVFACAQVKKIRAVISEYEKIELARGDGKGRNAFTDGNNRDLELWRRANPMVPLGEGRGLHVREVLYTGSNHDNGRGKGKGRGKGNDHSRGKGKGRGKGR